MRERVWITGIILLMLALTAALGIGLFQRRRNQHWLLQQLTVERQLRGIEERFRLLFEGARDAIFWADADTGLITHCNRAAETLLGRDRTEIIGKHQTFLHPPEKAEHYREHFRSHVTLDPQRDLEAEVIRKDGHCIAVEVFPSVIAVGGQRIIQGIFRDVTERKRAEEELKLVSSRQQAILAAAPDIIAEVDTNKVYQWMNRAGFEFFGDDAIGHEAAFYYEGEQETYKAVTPLFNGVEDVIYVESWQKRKDGQKRLLAWWCRVLKDEKGVVIGSLSTARDITEQKLAEGELARYRDRLEGLVEERTRELEKSREQLQRAQRLASIGTLAAGIAHEINNPLGMMLLSMDLALDSLHKPDALGELLRQQKQDVERCSRIVKGVLDFARQQSTKKWSLDLNDIVRHGMDFTREYAKTHGVTVEARLANAPGPIVGNATELEQVVVNLVYNAVQACSAQGRVTIETYRRENKVRLEVSDNGCGMTPEQIEHAFDPFFTTRLEKGGTGLGLSTLHGIVTSHGGNIGISSEPGKGAVFTIEFPRHSETEGVHGEDPGR